VNINISNFYRLGIDNCHFLCFLVQAIVVKVDVCCQRWTCIIWKSRRGLWPPQCLKVFGAMSQDYPFSLAPLQYPSPCIRGSNIGLEASDCILKLDFEALSPRFFPIYITYLSFLIYYHNQGT